MRLLVFLILVLLVVGSIEAGRKKKGKKGKKGSSSSSSSSGSSSNKSNSNTGNACDIQVPCTSLPSVKHGSVKQLVVARFSCPIGFDLVGDCEVACSEKTCGWDSDFPVCMPTLPTPDPEPTPPAHGVEEGEEDDGNDDPCDPNPCMNGGQCFRVFETAQRSRHFCVCDNGYDGRHCSFFAGPPSNCKELRAPCSKPMAPQNGTVSFEVIAAFTCDPGYVLVGEREIECLFGDCIWSDAPPYCEKEE